MTAKETDMDRSRIKEFIFKVTKTLWLIMAWISLVCVKIL